MLAAATMSRSAKHVRTATQLDRAYQDAADAVREQDFWVTEYLVRLAAPEKELSAAKLRGEHVRTTRDLRAALATVARLGGARDRALANYVERSQTAYLAAVQRLFAAVDRGDAADSLHFETEAVDPSFERYEGRIEAAAAAHRHTADDRLGALDRTGMIVLIAALVASALGLLLAVPLARSVRLSRKALSKAAFRDLLTGLHNRRAFVRDLDEALATCAAAREPVAVALLDLDGLKRVNDEHGHDRGDALIRTFGDSLGGAVGGRSRAYRFGGDEFAVIVPGAMADDAVAIVTRAREALIDSWDESDIDVSAGIAERTDLHPLALAGEHDKLVRESDVALISAKRGGHGALVYSPRLDEGFTSRTPRG